MRVPRVHCPEELEAGRPVVLSDAASHHLIHVLRLRPRAGVALFNSASGEFRCAITDRKAGRVTVTPEERVRTFAPPPLEAHLGIGLLRGERMDYGIRKCAELGASGITPLLCEFGEARPGARLERWRKVAVAASEQCGRLDVPAVHPPRPLAEWLEAAPAGPKLLLDPGGTDGLDGLDAALPLSLAGGPEGGFSGAETGRARRLGFRIVGLGPRTLRAETAPVAALAVLQHRYGDLARPA